MTIRKQSGLEDLIEALQIFAKYDTERSGWPTHCEHDVLYVANIGCISGADGERLEELGFLWTNENDGWLSYRFGRA